MYTGMIYDEIYTSIHVLIDVVHCYQTKKKKFERSFPINISALRGGNLGFHAFQIKIWTEQSKLVHRPLTRTWTTFCGHKVKHIVYSLMTPLWLHQENVKNLIGLI